jgi:hypothetical protein
MTTRELDKLKSKLPKRYRMILWKRLNRYSLRTIGAVLKGEFDNKEILDAAIFLAEEHQNDLRSQKDKISSL